MQIVTNSFEVITAKVDFITLLHIAIPVATNGLLSSKISRRGGAIVALPIARGARLACCLVGHIHGPTGRVEITRVDH